jgi:hypothetical protein
MKKKIFMLLTLLMVAVTSTWAESLTTYQGEGDNKATSFKLPVYGFNTDSYQKGEFVMSADSLEEMVGKKIKAMKFPLKQSATGVWYGDFVVFLKEIEGATLSKFSGMEDATIVYEGALDATGDTMVIKFDTSYKYKGGNLLIGIYNPEGNMEHFGATFQGTTVIGGGVQGNSYEEFDDITATGVDFVPTTKFVYEELGRAFDLYAPEEYNEHGTVTFKVDGEEVTQACEDDKVTVIVKPKAGYVVKGAMGEWDAAIAAARRNEPIARESLDMLTDIDLTSVEAEDSTWTFTMVRADAVISTSYKKLLSNPDITITDIQEVIYADGDSLKPTFIVKDGETVLQKDVDYTVSYDNNVNACEATAENAPTITITALETSDAYAGDTTVTFTILKAPGVIYFEKQFLNKERFDEPFINKLIHTREGAEGGEFKVDGIVTFSLSGDDIATVDEETGLVTIKDAPGVIIITATVEDGQNYTYANKTAAYTVSVGVYMENPPYYEGEDPVLVAHKLALLTVINIAKEIDLSTKTDKTANILRQTIADCEELLPSKTITHEELDEARIILLLAIDNLEDLIPEDADADVANGQNKEDETATGIVDYKSAAKAGILYDLNGRKVMNAQKGVYIMNGKKVVIK